MAAAGGHPIGIIAHEKRDGSDASGNDTAPAGSDGFQGGGMRRQASPADCASEAELIENLRRVARDALAEDAMLPGICRRFKTLQLAQNCERAALAGELCAGRGMLPAQ